MLNIYVGPIRRTFAPSERAWMTLSDGAPVPMSIERLMARAQPDRGELEIVGARLGDHVLTCSYYPGGDSRAWWFDPMGYRGFPVASGRSIAIELVNHSSMSVEVTVAVIGTTKEG